MKHPRTGEPLGAGFMTSHGFRHTTSSMLNELEYPAEATELQMPHVTQKVVRGTYNKAKLMPTRISMMQELVSHIKL
ncbi:MAG: integrase [Polaribacter sp.]|jgi:integrase